MKKMLMSVAASVIAQVGASLIIDLVRKKNKDAKKDGDKNDD